MRIAITGGTGFVGRHFTRRLLSSGHDVVLIARGTDRRDQAVRQLPGASFVAADISSAEELTNAFRNCDAVAHFAGINREIGKQTYKNVHVDGTRNVLAAAAAVGLRKILMLSFLRARPGCGSAYHESKWKAEELIRQSGLNYTVIKAGMIYGKGDHMLDHLCHSLHTLPVFAKVGFQEKPIAPLAIEDLVSVLQAALVDSRFSRKTMALLGPDILLLSEAVRRVAHVLGKRVYCIPAPVWLHYTLAPLFERAMKVPLVSTAQVRILEEGVTEPSGAVDTLPTDFTPRLGFTPQQIVNGLPPRVSFGLRDLRCWADAKP